MLANLYKTSENVIFNLTVHCKQGVHLFGGIILEKIQVNSILLPKKGTIEKGLQNG